MLDVVSGIATILVLYDFWSCESYRAVARWVPQAIHCRAMKFAVDLIEMVAGYIKPVSSVAAIVWSYECSAVGELVRGYVLQRAVGTGMPHVRRDGRSTPRWRN